jgi:hypothetical protein
MASSAPNTIVLRSNNPDNMMQRVQEAPCQAAVTILPGHLLAWGTTNTVKPHATANAALEGRKVALENPWSDHGSGKNIDHAYAAGETVPFIFAQSGDVLYMWLEDEGNVTKGAPLAPNGSGELQAITVDATVVAESVFGYADEAVNNTGGTGAVRIRVRVA